MKTTVKLQSTNRGCCFNSTYKEIGSLNGIFGVSIDTTNNTITVDHTDEVSRETIIQKLREMGYLPIDDSQQEM